MSNSHLRETTSPLDWQVEILLLLQLLFGDTDLWISTVTDSVDEIVVNGAI